MICKKIKKKINHTRNFSERFILVKEILAYLYASEVKVSLRFDDHFCKIFLKKHGKSS